MGSENLGYQFTFYRMKCENSSLTIYGIILHMLPWQLQYVYNNWQVLHIG